MGTLGELKARILDETKRPSLTSQCAKAIEDAIEFYSTHRFWFNEALDESITTVAGTASYTKPPYLRRLLQAEITIGGQRTDLYWGLPWEDYRYLTGGSPVSGQPTDLIFFGDRLYLYPTPAGTYPVSLTHTSRLAPLSDDSGSNAWTTEAEPLIRARAKWDLFQNVIRDYAEAAEAAAEENRWFGRLQTRDAGQGRQTRIVASDF